jgi:hypothetical protein
MPRTFLQPAEVRNSEAGFAWKANAADPPDARNAESRIGLGVSVVTTVTPEPHHVLLICAATLLNCLVIRRRHAASSV